MGMFELFCTQAGRQAEGKPARWAANYPSNGGRGSFEGHKEQQRLSLVPLFSGLWDKRERIALGPKEGGPLFGRVPLLWMDSRSLSMMHVHSFGSISSSDTLWVLVCV